MNSAKNDERQHFIILKQMMRLHALITVGIASNI